MSISLVFDQEHHEYRVGGRVLPSVTQLMDKYGITNSEWYGYQASIRGSYVHKATEFMDEDDLDIEDQDELLQPFLRAYEKFKAEANVTWELSELQMYHDLDWFAGTLDRTGFLPNGKRILVDIKSGGMPAWVHIQLAGYRKLLKRHESRIESTYRPIEDFYALQLRKDGTYRFNKIPILKIHEGQKIIDSMLLLNHFNRTITREPYAG